MTITQQSIKQQVNRYHAIDNWFYSPQGILAGQSFIEVISAFFSLLQGDNLLQIGQCGINPWLNQLYFLHKWIATPYKTSQPNHIVTSLLQLPFKRISIDCAIAPLSIEAFNDSNYLLDEIDRVLKPRGYLIILGINPFSMWGAGAKFGLLTGFSQNTLQLRASFNVNRACLLRNYQQITLTNFGYIPPVQSKVSIQQLFFMDKIGKMLWPFPANLYCYIAQKNENSPSLSTDTLVNYATNSAPLCAGSALISIK